MRDMEIFITGSAGFIGLNLKKFLNEAGHTVVEFDLTEGDDLLDAPIVLEATRFCDAIIHLGAIASILHCEKNPHQAIMTNVLGTMNVAQAAHLHKIPLVYASTFAAKNPRNVYGLTKRLGEPLVLKAGGVVLRLANIYGGDGYLENKTNAVANFVNMKLRNDKAVIHGDGSASRDFTHLDDVCRAFIAALNTPSGTYDVCTGVQTSILDLAKMIGVDYEFSSPREADSVQPVADQGIYGWSAQVGLEEGLKRLI